MGNVRRELSVLPTSTFLSKVCDFIGYVCDGTAETGPPGGGQEKEMVNLI